MSMMDEVEFLYVRLLKYEYKIENIPWAPCSILQLNAPILKKSAGLMYRGHSTDVVCKPGCNIGILFTCGWKMNKIIIKRGNKEPYLEMEVKRAYALVLKYGYVMEMRDEEGYSKLTPCNMYWINSRKR